MLPHYNFSWFIAGLSVVTPDRSMTEWVQHFKEGFINVDYIEKAPSELLFIKCRAYEIHFTGPVFNNSQQVYEDNLPKLGEFRAMLFVGNNFFYLLVEMTDDQEEVCSDLNALSDKFESLPGNIYRNMLKTAIITLKNAGDKFYCLCSSSEDISVLEFYFNHAIQMLESPVIIAPIKIRK